MSFSQEEFDEFKTEALELLEGAEKSLLALDQGAAEFRSAFDTIFRGFHNLKGGAGMMELLKLQSHTHELESIFMRFKESDSIPKEYISLFLRGVDAARSILNGENIEFDFAATPPPVEITTPLPRKEEGLDEFVSECGEIVERLSQNLQKIEARAYTKETLDDLYRDVHSLKGSAYLFSFASLGDLAHAMESSLEKVRSGTHVPSKLLIDWLFKSLKVIEGLLGRIKAQASTETLDAVVPALASALSKLEESLSPIPPAPVEVKVSNTMSESKRDPVQETNAEIKIEAKAPETEATSSIRVPVALLDNLMTLMGEMVLVRNQVLQYSNKSEDLEFLSMSKRLNVVTSEIQGEMMKTRMQPIGNVLGKFNRVVRDLSQELRKQVQLNISGAETELDKSLLEAIKDPLTHIVRNSCDHGVEIPSVRRNSGKPEMGTISIKAYHEGGQVVIEVTDDGKGLHKDILLKKALEKGLISQTQAAALSEKEIFNLIFAPGFSTAAAITNVSGRGVGMDVVRTNVERIGGTVELNSVACRGTVTKLKIPLTLAIVPALIVRQGLETFAIPQMKLEELVRVDSSSQDNKIEYLHGAPVYRLRGNILPLVDLGQILGLPPRSSS